MTGGPAHPVGPLGDRGAGTERSVAAGDDAVARREQEAFDEGPTEADLRARARRGRAARTERFRNLLGWLQIGAAGLGFVILTGLALVYALHLVLPETRQWLSEGQVDTLQGLFTGVVGTLILNQVRKGLD